MAKKKVESISLEEAETKKDIKNLIVNSFEGAKVGKNKIFIEYNLPLYVEKRPKVVVRADRLDMGRFTASNASSSIYEEFETKLKTILGEDFNNVRVTQRFIKPYKKAEKQQYKLLIEVEV